MALIWLPEQLIIPYFSCSFFTCLLVLRAMIFLTINAAIFHEFASRAKLQFDVIYRCLATVSAYFVVYLCAPHDMYFRPTLN
jgi:hypothetical protein